MIKIDKKVLEQAVEKWGVPSQSDMIIEECAELIQALSKMKRKMADPEKCYTNLIEELADVTIMMSQAEIMFNKLGHIQEAVDFKMERLNQTLKN
jgi:NTP pyrophosphatase (non-canonical NTP hydrolase)